MRELQRQDYRVFLVSSLDHVMPDQEPRALQETCLYAACGEWVHLQVACRTEIPLQLTMGFRGDIRTYRVERVPCRRPCNERRDEDYLFTEPGMYPDRLVELEHPGFSPSPDWQSIFVSIRPWETGETELEIACGDDALSLTVRTLPEMVPLRLHHTEWFHADCLADYYNVPVFSEEHWKILENFIRAAAEHGVNMLYTPLFTPPLDTGEGGERTTVQLVRVSCRDGYTFDYTLLDRWIRLAQRCGIREIECSHLFTQWGAKYAPKIMAVNKEGEEVRIFGWDTPGTGEDYLAFLRVFLPSLREHLEGLGVLEHTWFHISDEPGLQDLPQYARAVEVVREYLQGCRMLDALSHIEFWREGLVQTPVCAIDQIEPFLEAGVKPLFGYYCTAQCEKVPNRFIAMPQRRHRIMGVLLYRAGLQGFLQWGFNFYNSQYSVRHLDPHESTDADGAFPSGDPFLVYPEEGGVPGESLRGMISKEAVLDYRMLCTLEDRIGRPAVEQLLDRLFPGMSFTSYPRDTAFFHILWDEAGRLMGS